LDASQPFVLGGRALALMRIRHRQAA
jgi:hypothetical protein